MTAQFRYLFLLLLLVGCDGIGCDKVERDWTKCNDTTPCDHGFICLNYSCVQGADASVTVELADAPVAGQAADTALGCADDGECPPSAPTCLDSMCAKCKDNADCAGRADAATGSGACDTTSGRCVACLKSSDCPADQGRPICAANQCVPCQSASECRAKSADLPACESSTGACVQCTANADCINPRDGRVGDGGSDGGVNGRVCSDANTCVECNDDGDCTPDPAKRFCRNSACVGCQAAGPGVCPSPTRACARTGDKTGQCVECADNSTCSGTTPICAIATNTCRNCATDSECSAISPGVCVVDGHCATDAETVYVGTLGAAICSEAKTGTAQAPVCSVQKGVSLAMAGSKPVIVVRGALSAGSTTISASSPLTIVGKNNATITPTAGADCITINQGEIHLRSLTIVGSASAASAMGINATTGVTLTIDGCKVTNNPGGGIFLNGAAFDIENTTVSGNGPGQTTGGTLWGGIRVESTPPAGSPTTLKLLTIQDNSPIGLSCSATIPNSTTVLATGNNSSTNPTYQISGCGFSSCTPGVGTACGAP